MVTRSGYPPEHACSSGLPLLPRPNHVVGLRSRRPHSAGGELVYQASKVGTTPAL